MGSYIKTDDFEYSKEYYDFIIEMYKSFIEEIPLEYQKENREIIFDFDILEKILCRQVTETDKLNIRLFKKVCALVHQSKINIIEKNKHNPSVVRLTSLFVYYIVKLQPVKCLVLEKKNDKNPKDRFAWFDLEMSVKFALELAIYLFEEYNKQQQNIIACMLWDRKNKCYSCKLCIDVDFLYSTQSHCSDYKETLMFTLTHKTVSKAMVIQLFDYFDKAEHRHDDNGGNKMGNENEDKQNPTISMDRISNSNTFSISNVDMKNVKTDFANMMRKNKEDNIKFIDKLFDDMNAND